jgi:anthranilate phosphoribosyltransferase
MPNPTLTGAIDALAQRRDLSADEAAEVLAEIMHGEASEAQIAAFLIALRTKGETVDELTGLARTMRELAAPVRVSRADLLDTAGTGGGRSTFNVSTTAALIAAGAGCAVAKHGNRSATSRSGSADVLEALGARIDLRPDGVAACIEQAGFGFMFAPAHHQATRFVMPVRRELAVRTIFNFLGPLTNPAGARRQLIGVSDPSFQEIIAGALARLGVDRALVVSSEDSLDELSIDAATNVIEVNGEQITRYSLVPRDVGVEPDAGAGTRAGASGSRDGSASGASGDSAGAGAAALQGGSPDDNAAVTRAVLRGEPGPAAELALINAGAAIYTAGAAETIADGVAIARETLLAGRAQTALERFIAATERNAPTPQPAR